MQRILVIGTSGSGKSTLAERLSKRLDLPFFASDHFHWECGWRIAPPEKVRQQVRAVISQEAWVLDGNFDEEHDWLWKSANCIIWLDYPLITVLRQVTWRNLNWVVTRQQTWSGNRMSLSRAISGIHHAVRSYPLKRQIYPGWLSEFSGTTVYRFRTKQETETWFQALSSTG